MELSSESRNPSELAVNRMVTEARELRAELDDDDGVAGSESFLAGPGSVALPPMLQYPADARAPVLPDSSRPSAGAGKAKAKPKARSQAKAERPGVVASRIRRETMKPWTTLQTSIKNALELAPVMLEECVAEYASEEEAIAQDSSYGVVRARLAALRMLSNQKRERPSEATSKPLSDLLAQDPYFNEQCWPVSAIQTLGQLSHMRGTVLELQGTAAAVAALGEEHKCAIDVLKTVATAVCTEVTSWRSSIKSLKKARELEEICAQREAQKEAKKEKQKKKSDEAKAAKELARKEKDNKAKEAAAAEAQGAQEDEAARGGGAQSKRRRKPVPEGQISDADPALLQALAGSDWPLDYIMPSLDTPEELASFIVRTCGMLPCKMRLRRSSIKKVIEADPTGCVDKQMHRKIGQEINEFSSDFEAKLKGREDLTKQLRLIEAPASTLALDVLVLQKVDDSGKRDLQFLSREDMGERPGGQCTSQCRIVSSAWFSIAGNCVDLCRFSECGEDDAAKAKSGLRWRGAALTASKVGSLFAGFCPTGIPTMYNHVLNDKLLCIVDLSEAIAWYCHVKEIDSAAEGFVPPALKDVTNFVANQSIDAASVALVSMSGTTVSAGDVVYIPPCSLMVEKSIGAGTSVGIRDLPAEIMHRMTKKLPFERMVSLGEAATGDRVPAPGTPGSMSMFNAPPGSGVEPVPTVAQDGTVALQDLQLPQDLKELMDEMNKFIFTMSDEDLRAEVPASLLDVASFNRHIQAVVNHRFYEDYRKYVVVELMEEALPETDEAWPWSILDEEGDQFEDLLGWYAYMRKRGAKHEAEASHCQP
ncbi:unnamed protein product [Symbiodinium sp. CCMP2592]|nr:unnamed protein product [Symbiodinium sp. CCMP2592]